MFLCFDFVLRDKLSLCAQCLCAAAFLPHCPYKCRLAGCVQVIMSSFNKTNYYDMHNSEIQCVNSVQQSEFGNFQETYNWVECVSLSFPGKVYFFNLRTRCSTWIRPVSKDVQLQRFNRNSKIYNNNFTTASDNTDISLMIISSGSEKDTSNDDEKCPTSKIVKKGPNDASSSNKNVKSSKMITHSYNNVVKTSFYNNNYGKYFDSDFSRASKNLYANNNYFYVLNLLFYKVVKGSSKESNCSEGNKICKNFDLVTATTCKLIAPKTEPADVTDANKQLTQKDNLNLKERKNDIVQNSSAVHCNTIKPRGLPAKKGVSKKRQMQAKKEKLKPTKIKPTIREMYGSKTINYDFIDREQPPDVKTTCLSESSVASSLRQADDPKPIIEDCYEFFGVKSQLNLSSSSSSNTCCSCSSSSVTSDTGSTTSSTASALSLR